MRAAGRLFISAQMIFASMGAAFAQDRFQVFPYRAQEAGGATIHMQAVFIDWEKFLISECTATVTVPVSPQAPSAKCGAWEQLGNLPDRLVLGHPFTANASFGQPTFPGFWLLNSSNGLLQGCGGVPIRCAVAYKPTPP